MPKLQHEMVANAGGHRLVFRRCQAQVVLVHDSFPPMKLLFTQARDSRAAEPATTERGMEARSFLRFFSELAGSSTDGWELVRYS